MRPTCPHCGTSIETHSAGLCIDKWYMESVLKCTYDFHGIVEEGCFKGSEYGEWHDKNGKWTYHRYPSIKISHAMEGVEKLEKN